MAVTMKDIARVTGLGLATISKYYNGGSVRAKNQKLIEETPSPAVSDEQRKRIIKLAVEAVKKIIGYVT